MLGRHRGGKPRIVYETRERQRTADVTGMTISSITSAQAAIPVSSAAAAAPAAPAAPADPADGTRLSGFGSFMSKLQSLEQSDPAKAKQVLGDIASKLSARAKEVGGTAGQHLSQLADKFQQASQTGDLSGLQPPQAQQGQHHHHGGGHHAKAAYSQSQDPSQTVDDTLASAIE